MQELEVLVRTALFKPATAIIGWLLQRASDRIDSQYQPKPGEERKGREAIQVQCLFGTFALQRDYYYHPGKNSGHHPTDAGLGLEGTQTPGLARLVCLEGADESTYLKAQRHLEQTGGIVVSARQIQRLVQRVGSAAQQWQERPAHRGSCDAPILYVSADGTGIPMVPAELKGRRGKQADGTAKTRQVYLGCVFTQHQTDDKGHPVRDWDSTTYLSSFQPIDEFGPSLRQEAIRRGMGASRRGSLRLLCPQRRQNAVRHLPPSRLLHRLGRGRGWLQNRHRRALQTIRHVLVQNRRRKHPRSVPGSGAFNP